MENYSSVTSDTGQDKTKWQSVWRIIISVLTLDKNKKLNGIHRGKLQYQFRNWTR